jgi:hypothetical protein
MASSFATIRIRCQDGFAAFLSCRALSSPTTCRFFPALSELPVTRARSVRVGFKRLTSPWTRKDTGSVKELMAASLLLMRPQSDDRRAETALPQ